MWNERGRLAAKLSLVLAALALTLAAANATPEEDQSAGATFARVRYLEGSVTLARAAEEELVEGSMNSPIAPGDRLWSEGGRAEIELADASMVWVGEDTRVDFRSLSDFGGVFEEANLLALEEGSIRVDLADPASSENAFQIDTMAGSIYLLSGGSFRIDADGDMTILSSFRGVAEFSGDGGSVLVRSGERSSVRSGRAPSEPRHFNTVRLDDFDRFCEERIIANLRDLGDEPIDEVIEEVPREVHHYVHELSFYGHWHNLPSYGWVWRPTYHASWAPYYSGYWTLCPTGWAWVSYEPWGWAPYHYGRWDFSVNLGWFWIPGGHWSGAWVSFAVGPSYVGWAPLNYYNYPVFHDVHIVNAVNINAARLGRGWHFAPVGHFAARGKKWAALHGERPEGKTEMVLTRRLPRFSPKAVAANPGRGRRFVEEVRASRTSLPSAADRAGRRVSFRDMERRAVKSRGASAARQPKRLGASDPRLARPIELDGSRSVSGRSDSEKGGSKAQVDAPRADGKTTRARADAPRARKDSPRPKSEAPKVSRPKRSGDHVVEKLVDGARKTSSRSRPSRLKAEERGKERPSADKKSSNKGSKGRPSASSKSSKPKSKPKGRPSASSKSSKPKSKPKGRPSTSSKSSKPKSKPKGKPSSKKRG